MLTTTRLMELLDYNPETGEWTWKVDRGNRSAGAKAGATKSNGYLQIRVDEVIYLSHRLAFLFMLGRWPEGEVDHRDLVKTNNAWANLRECSHAQNQCNTRSIGNKTGLKGVYFEARTGKFYTQIRVDGRRRSIGTFATAEEASKARNEAAVQYHGSFHRLE